MLMMPHLGSKIILARYLLLFASTAITLAGCQSSTPISSANRAAPIIDFNTVNPDQIQAQSTAFHAKLAANAKAHQQLFDQSNAPNSDYLAKQNLMTAIRQHLDTEHTAVARAHYQMTPFINDTSIDAGSTGLLRTIIETYAYNANRANDDGAMEDYEKYDDHDSDDNHDSADVADFDEQGFDEYGYSREDYAYDDDYDEVYKDNYDYDDYKSAPRGLNALKNIDPKEILDNYEAMQQAKIDEKTEPQSPDDMASASGAGMFGMMLGMIHKTPEQVAAASVYQYQPMTVNSVSRYKPKSREFQSVYSYDYAAPTVQSSIQIPLALDFNQSRLTLDPSAIMPLVALMNPEHTPLPDEMTAHTVNFGLPETITEQLPSAVIYDAAINGLQDSLAELSPEYFSAIDIRDDNFARDVGAAKAIKVYFGSKQTGEIIGKMLKYMSQSLETYIDANPDKYPDDAKLKQVIKKVQLYNKGYQSTDVGALLQLIEAVAPISFNQVNYYYLDNNNRLLAKEQRMRIGGDLMGSTTQVINQIRYDDAQFTQHPLYGLLAQSFGKTAAPAMDGNAWLEAQRQQKDRLATARYARYDYDYQDNTVSYGDDSAVTDSAVINP